MNYGVLSAKFQVCLFLVIAKDKTLEIIEYIETQHSLI